MVNKPMFVKIKIVVIPNLSKKKMLLEQDLDLSILLFNEWNKMLSLPIVLHHVVFTDLNLKL